MIRSRLARWLAIALCGVALLCGIAYLVYAPPSAYVALTPSGGFTENGEFPSVNPTPVKTKRYGSWSGSDAKTGVLTSAPFRSGGGLALAYAGYPSNPGETVRLETTDGTESTNIALVNDGETWLHVMVLLPAGWAGKNVRLVAADGSSAFEGWFGVADVRPVSAIETLTSDVRVRLIAETIAAATLFIPAVFAGLLLCRRCRLPELFVFSAALIVLGCAALALFFATMIDMQIAAYLFIAIAIGGCIATGLSLRRPDIRASLRRTDCWMPFALTMLAAILYLAVVDVTNSASASAMALLPLLSLPIDNALPHILAQHIAAHASPEPFMGDWLSSDRPPLQAGFDLMANALAPFIADTTTRYEALSIVLQATIFGALYTLCRLCSAGPMRAIGIVTLALFSGFFFTNTIYVWPKLISASYVAIALAVAYAPGRLTYERAMLIGVTSALGLLSHGGVAFTIPALLVALYIAQRNATWRILAVGVASALVVFAPWTWYQHAYDPPGDRLLKWHLAGHIPPTQESFAKLLVHAYTLPPIGTIAANKVSNVQTLWNPWPVNHSGQEFYFVSHAIGALGIPFIAAALLVRIKRFRRAGELAWIAIGSLLFWCLAMYGPNTTVVHQGSYLTMALMFVAGGLIATEWWPLFAIVLAAQVFDFVQTWLAPLSMADVATPGGIITLAVFIVALALFGVAVRAIAVRPSALPQTG